MHTVRWTLPAPSKSAAFDFQLRLRTCPKPRPDWDVSTLFNPTPRLLTKTDIASFSLSSLVETHAYYHTFPQLVHLPIKRVHASYTLDPETSLHRFRIPPLVPLVPFPFLLPGSHLASLELTRVLRSTFNMPNSTVTCSGDAQNSQSAPIYTSNE
jgi:hypothetical protein